MGSFVEEANWAHGRARSQTGVPALGSLPYPKSRNGFGARTCIWQKQSVAPSAWVPAHGAVGADVPLSF